MPQISLPIPVIGMDNDQLAEYISKIVKDIEWLLSGALDSKNIRNIAGFNVGNYDLKHISGIVGISGYDPANPEAVRFWAGDADKSIAPYRVLQNGYMYSTRGFIGGWDIDDDKLSGTGTIEGGTIVGSEIMTALADVYPRASMSSINELFSAEQSADEFIKMVANYLGSVALLIESTTVSGVIGPTGNDLLITTFLNNGNIQISSGEDLLLYAATGKFVKVQSWSTFSNNTGQTLQQALDAKQDDVTSGDITIIGGTATLNSGIPATKIAGGTVDNAEFQTLNGVTSSIQTQLNTKATVVSSGNKIQSGTVTVNAASPQTITFSSSFGAAPLVFIQPVSAGNVTVGVNGSTAADFTFQSSANVSVTYYWFAIGS